MQTVDDRGRVMARLPRPYIGWGIAVMAALILTQLSFASTLAMMPARDALATPRDGSSLCDCLVGSWVHSWEEDTDEVTVYRPTGYPFSPGRGREGYEFLSGGSLIYHGIGPADASTSEPGRWEEVAPYQVAITIEQPDGSGVSRELGIVSCDAERLEVRNGSR